MKVTANSQFNLTQIVCGWWNIQNLFFPCEVFKFIQNFCGTNSLNQLLPPLYAGPWSKFGHLPFDTVGVLSTSLSSNTVLDNFH